MIITDKSKLTNICEPALPEEVDSIIRQLEKNLFISAGKNNPGIGLAAPQIGINKRVAIIRLGKEGNINLVNCNIADKYDLVKVDNEGCLSFPGKRVNTYRYNEIYVENNFVEPYCFVATGIHAIAIQHELDHLDGILFFKRTEQCE